MRLFLIDKSHRLAGGEGKGSSFPVDMLRENIRETYCKCTAKTLVGTNVICLV